MTASEFDAVVVGAGPNGLAAAISLAEAGLNVRVLERAEVVGGGVRTEPLTLPGFRHDVCSAIHPLGASSPFLRRLPLDQHGLRWIQPPVMLAHPLDDGSAALLERSVEGTAESLGADGRRYRRLMEPLAAAVDDLLDTLFARPPSLAHPVSAARFGLKGLRSAAGFARRHFREDRARAILTGISGHALVPLTQPATASFGLLFAAVGHAYGWPLAQGGSQAIADAMASYLRSLGGEIEVGREVRSTADLPPARAKVFDVTPRQLLAICGDELPSGYRHRLERFRYGAGVFKVDWALSAPVPWKAEGCSSAGTVHLGGTYREIVDSEAAVAGGRHPQRPYMVTAQQSLFDPSRAPEGEHTFWGYCHVPNSSTMDMTRVMEDQIERFAPGFKDLILDRHVIGTAALEAHDPNCVGGDINGGASDLRQLFTRPVVKLDPYSTAANGVFICSSSTPPGGGVHGMCGANAARSVKRFLGLKL